MNWFKKILNSLEGTSEKSAANEESLVEEKSVPDQESTLEMPKESRVNPTEILQEKAAEEIQEIKPQPKATPKQAQNAQKPINNVKNAIELEEFALTNIIRKMKPLSYSGVKLSGINFHFKNAKTSSEAVAAQKIFVEDDKFLNKLYRKLDDAGIAYLEPLKVKVIYNSESIEDGSLYQVEVLTPKETNGKYKGKITITEGFAWQEEYILDQNPEKIYYIGRGKNPKLESGLRVKNDIAFVSLDEESDPKFAINNYISRSMAFIYFDADTNQFILKRSAKMKNSNHVLKVFRDTVSGIQESNLTHISMSYALESGDQIMINDKLAMEFQKVDIEK